MFFLNVSAEPALVDINVTPDKRTVMLQREVEFLELLRGGLETLWDPGKWQMAHSLGGADVNRTCVLPRPTIESPLEKLFYDVYNQHNLLFCAFLWDVLARSCFLVHDGNNEGMSIRRSALGVSACLCVQSLVAQNLFCDKGHTA
jgi:hypothetical protein